MLKVIVSHIFPHKVQLLLTKQSDGTYYDIYDWEPACKLLVCGARPTVKATEPPVLELCCPLSQEGTQL